jgi:hypothetical protein
MDENFLFQVSGGAETTIVKRVKEQAGMGSTSFSKSIRSTINLCQWNGTAADQSMVNHIWIASRIRIEMQ